MVSSPVPAKRFVALPFAIILCLAMFAYGQGAPRFMGSVTGITGNTLTVKTDAGEEKQVQVPEGASLKRIEPGQKDLSSAANMTLSDLEVGDRVLVRIDPNANGATPQASLVIAIKQADVAKKQEQEREDWQRRGVAGLVKSVDPAAGSIVIASGAGPTSKAVVIKTSKSTVLRRYAPGSVRFADAQPAPLDAIRPGDQLRARGQKSPDGNEIDADEVVSGTFRNIAGTVSSLDPSASTLTVKDLASKKQVTIHVSADAQMRKIPERMAQMLAARLKGGASGPQHAQRSGEGASGAETAGQWSGRNGGGGAPGGGDPQRVLSMAPQIKLSDLQKGDAVMVVTTDGKSGINAVTLLAGVEPLLEAPAATDLLSNWSMGGGGAESAGAGIQ